MKKQIGIILVISLVLSGCTQNPNEVPDQTESDAEVPDQTESDAEGPDQTESDALKLELPIVNVTTNQGLRINLENGSTIHALRLNAESAFTIDSISWHGSVSSLDDIQYGIALWPEGENPRENAACNFVISMIWDNRMEYDNVDWQTIPAGNYNLWIWNAKGTWIGVELNGGSADENSSAYSPTPIGWHVNATTADWVQNANGASFNQTLNLGEAAVFVARANPPTGLGLEPSASMMLHQEESVCDEDSTEAGALQQPGELRISGIASGEVTWSGHYNVELIPNSNGQAAAVWFTK